MPMIDLPWCPVCPYRKKCDDDVSLVGEDCSKRYIYDTLSGLVYTGSVWSPDVLEAKKYSSWSEADSAIEKIKIKQAEIVRDLPKQFGG